MVLKLDAAIPQVWRDPFSLQFGVDPARVVLREVSSAQERMIWALSSGVSRSGLSMIAQSAGAAEGDVVRLLDAIGPLLTDPAPAPTIPTVAIVGAGMTVERIASGLAETGVRVEVTSSPSEDPCDLGIVVGHYVLDPPSYGFWLRRDIPHLPVIFGDGSVIIGPLIAPGVGPCLYCLEHHRRDADASWSAIASQLWGRRSPAETPLISREVAALASRLAMQHLESERSQLGPRVARILAAATSFRLSTLTGEVTRTEWMPHPECGCITMPQTDAPVAVSAIPQEIGSAAAAPRGSTPRPPRTTAAASALA
jgi:bacteriocin biosynthesis cyclodehydratase domain-containing protein